MIPEAAVEAAAIAWSGPLEWLAHSDEWRDDRREDARSALEAAAPHMEALALREAADALEAAAQWSARPVPETEKIQRWLRARASWIESP